MWTYLLRRVLMMIPTLFGVTVVSFCVMQLAPGDPLISQMGSGGQSTQTRDSFLIQKRDLKLDKPLLLNTRYFTDYTVPVTVAAHFAGRSDAEIAEELPALAAEAANPADPELRVRLKFLQELGIEDFQKQLADAEGQARLAHGIGVYIQIFCEDLGLHGVPTAVELAANEQAELKDRIGAIRCLNKFTTKPFVFTFSAEEKPEEAPAVQSAWRIWWERKQEAEAKRKADEQAVEAAAIEAESKLPAEEREKAQTARRQRKAEREQTEVETAIAAVVRATAVDKLLDDIAKGEGSDLLDLLDKFEIDAGSPLGEQDQPSLVKHVLAEQQAGDAAGFARLKNSVTLLKLTVREPLDSDAALDATPEVVAEVSANWKVWYDPRKGEFQPSALSKSGLLFRDTQYSHMVWRLATFQFGKATLPPHEPVVEKVGNAFAVSAPLMLMSQAFIFLVAVPLGLLAAVYRDRLIDRTVTSGLLMLYSIPAFVAGMLMLLFLCYGTYLKWFPMKGLQTEGAENLALLPWLGDYLWHAALPVTCLSLFSLALMSMYSRSSLLDVLNQDYIRTARAKGLSEYKVILKHGLRNGLIPIITLFANFLPAMLSGSVLVEHLFNIQGMGYLSLRCITQKDISTLMAILYLDAILVMFSMLLSDVLYVLADPRIDLAAKQDG